MAARREHCKSVVGARERGRKLVPALREGETRTECRPSEKQHQLEKGSTATQNRHRLIPSYLDAERLANYVYVKFRLNSGDKAGAE